MASAYTPIFNYIMMNAEIIERWQLVLIMKCHPLSEIKDYHKLKVCTRFISLSLLVVALLNILIHHNIYNFKGSMK